MRTFVYNSNVGIVKTCRLAGFAIEEVRPNPARVETRLLSRNSLSTRRAASIVLVCNFVHTRGPCGPGRAAGDWTRDAYGKTRPVRRGRSPRSAALGH